MCPVGKEGESSLVYSDRFFLENISSDRGALWRIILHVSPRVREEDVGDVREDEAAPLPCTCPGTAGQNMAASRLGSLSLLCFFALEG